MKSRDKILQLQILNGPLKGSQWVLKKGLTLSRSPGKNYMAIKEPAASNPHAKIIQRKKVFYLQDLDSKNGTLVEGEINDLFPLTPGLLFKIGKTRFQIAEQAEAPKPEPHWSQLLQKELQAYEPQFQDQPKKLIAFKPLLRLSFQSGVQKSDSWLIGYGPRQAGHASVDLPILDPSAPDLCFSLHPHIVSQNQEIRALFKTPCPDKVLINKQYLSKKILEKGDVISMAQTRILVDFV